MKLNLMFLAVSSALMNAEQDDGSNNAGGEQKKDEHAFKVPQKIESHLELGRKEGQRVKAAVERGEHMLQDLLLVYGEHYSALDEAVGNDFLTGYSSAWDVNTGKVRKSEAKAVFDAWRLKDELRRIVVDKDAQGGIIAEEHAVWEWFGMRKSLCEQHKPFERAFGSYRGLIALAKEMRGKATSQGAGGGRTRGVALTDKQMDEFVERLPAASPNQAMILAEKATAALTAMPGFQAALFREIIMICNTIKVKTPTNDPNAQIILDAASTMLEQAENVVAKLNATPVAATAKITAPSTPAPAQQQAQAETVLATGTNGK